MALPTPLRSFLASGRRKAHIRKVGHTYDLPYASILPYGISHVSLNPGFETLLGARGSQASLLWHSDNCIVTIGYYFIVMEPTIPVGSHDDDDLSIGTVQ